MRIAQGRATGPLTTAPALGEHERGEAEEQEQRLRVDRLQEQRRRKEREIEDGPAGAVRAQPLFGDPFEQHERAQRGQQREEDAGEHVVAAEYAPDAATSAG